MGSRFRLLAEEMSDRGILGEQGKMACQRQYLLVLRFTVFFSVA